MQPGRACDPGLGDNLAEKCDRPDVPMPCSQQDLGACDLTSTAMRSGGSPALSSGQQPDGARLEQRLGGATRPRARKNFPSNPQASLNQEAKLSILLPLMTLDLKYSNCLIQMGPGESAGLLH